MLFLHRQLCLMAVFLRHGFIKVGLICHIPFKCTGFKLIYQNIFCPAELLCCLDVKFTPDVVFAPPALPDGGISPARLYQSWSDLPYTVQMHRLQADLSEHLLSSRTSLLP